MFLQKITAILTTEIKWGRIALLALGAAVVAILVSGGTVNLLALTVFSIVGIFIERVAPKHPFVNSFCYGLLGVIFFITLLLLQALGEGQGALTVADLPWLILYVGIVALPQSLIGTWIGTSIRKFTRVAAEARKEGDAAADKKPDDKQRKSASSGKKASAARQQKKRG